MKNRLLKTDAEIALEGSLDTVKLLIESLLETSDTISRLKIARKKEENPDYSEVQYIKIIREECQGFSNDFDVMSEIKLPISTNVIQILLEEALAEREEILKELKETWELPLDQYTNDALALESINKQNEESSS